MSYDYVKSHRKPGFYPLFRRYIFRKNHRGRGQIDPVPAVLGLKVARLQVHATKPLKP